MKQDAWHYPRAGLAKRTYVALIDGPSHALLMFAPRRTGKTEFLLNDLGPLAAKKGHRVAYANLWENALSPATVIIQALDQARRSGSIGRRLTAAISQLPTKIKIGPPGAVVEVDVSELETKGRKDHLTILGDLIRQLANPKAPLFLLFDEVQELARDPNNATLIAALRTALDTHKAGVAAVFTGSSQAGLNAMFGAREAPFFRFASTIPFPPLDDGFIDHLRTVFEERVGGAPKRNALLAAFERLDRSPYFIRAALERMVLNPDLTLNSAIADVERDTADETGFAAHWARLTPLQRAVAEALSEGVEKPYAEEARAAMGTRKGGETPTSAQVQTALRTLGSRGLADRGSGRWDISDPAFARWIAAREEE